MIGFYLKKAVACMLLGVFMMTICFASYSAVYALEKQFDYAIQLAVFDSENRANSYLYKHKENLSQGLILKSKKYVVVYNVYPTKNDALAQMKNAKTISAGAYVIKLNNDEKLQVNEFMKKQAVPENKTTVSQNQEPIKDTQLTSRSTDVQGTKTELKTYNVPLREDIVLKGVFGVSSIGFTISDNWDIADGAYLEAYLSYADGKIYPESSATLFLNDVPIKSYYLLPNAAQPVKFVIPLDKNSIKSGFNELQVKTYLRTSKDLCENESNPANWIVILKKSYLHLRYKEQIDTPNLEDYPYPYVESGRNIPIDFDFIYDDSENNEDILRGIFTLAADIGRTVPFKNLNFGFKAPKEITPDHSYIYMGSEITSEIAQWIPKEYQLPKSELYIAELPLSAKNKMLLIISKNPKLIGELTNMLSHPEIVKQLKYKAVSFEEKDLIRLEEPKSSNVLKFSKLGYGNITFEATKTASAAYYIAPPGNWQILKGSKLVVKTRFSPLIDPETSTLTATINGIPVGSRVLNTKFSDGQTFEFLLPDDVLKANRFNIILAYSLGGEFKCEDLKSNKGIWAFIGNDSYIQFAKELKTDYKLDDLPSPMVVNDSFSQLNLVLDKKASIKEILLMTDLMAKLGQQTKRSTGFSIQFDEIKENANNIVIATAKSSLSKTLNTDAIVPYNETFNGFKSKPGLFMLASEQENYSTAQLINTGGKKPTSVLWITSLNEDGFGWVGKYLTDIALSTQVKGEAVLVSRDGLLQIYDSRKSDDDDNLKIGITSEPRATFENIRNYLIFLSSVLLFIVLIIIMKAKRRR